MPYNCRPSSSHPRHRSIAMACGLLLLAGCASKPPQGYGVTEAGTAAQAQQQMDKAEQSTQVDSQQTYLNLITQMQQANQWYASLAHTDAFERQYGATPQLRLLKADALRNTGQLPQAQGTYQSLLTHNDATVVARARRGLGLLFASQGQLPEAITQLEQARALNPIDADVLSDLAYAQMLAGQLEQAQLPILQAAQLASTNARVQLNLALYWLASGAHDQAAQLLQRLQQPQAKNAPPLINATSIQTLQQQLASVQQAMARHSAAASQQQGVAAPLASQATASAAIEKQP